MANGTNDNGIVEENGSDKKIPPDPKKFLFVSWESLSGDLAWHVAKEGHEVKVYIKAKTDADVYNGFVEKVETWEPYVDWADVIVFDDIEFGEMADKLRKKGKKVVGGSIYTDRLEADRDFGQSELKKLGVNVLPYQSFTSYNEAIEFIRNNPGRYVFKPSGLTPPGGSGLFFIGEDEDGKEMIELLEQNKTVWEKKVSQFILQKFISGVEIGVGAFFNGHDFIYPININFEHKRIFAGEIGPMTGEMGTLMYWSRPNNIFRATLEKALLALRESGYIGYIDINCIVNGKGIYPLEWTCRFGYPTIQIQQEGISTPAGEWLYKLASGENFELKTKRGFQIGVRILVPSYFAKSGGDSDLVQVYKDLAIVFKKHDPTYEGIHIEDVWNDNGTMRIAGVSGVLMVVADTGTTVEDARKSVYAKVKNIVIPNMLYRTDIGAKWTYDSDRLHTWGYLQTY